MTTRPSSSILLCALTLALVAASSVLSRAQAPAAAPADTNAAPVAPAPPAAAAPAPAPVAPAETTGTPAERPTTYTVVKGDTVSTIAHSFGLTWYQLRKANHLKKKAVLHIGQVLQIPPAKAEATTK